MYLLNTLPLKKSLGLASFMPVAYLKNPVLLYRTPCLQLPSSPHKQMKVLEKWACPNDVSTPTLGVRATTHLIQFNNSIHNKIIQIIL